MNYTISTDDVAEQLQLAHNAESWALLSDIDARIRSFIKYNEDIDPLDLLIDIRAEVLELLAKVEQ